MAFAGIDIGTSGCKLLVYDLEGHVIFRSSRKYREEGRDGFRELNPEVVLENVKIILSEAGKNCPENIEALAVASLGESVVCLDENNNILANSMLTGDCRGITEIQELIQHFGAQHIFEITGLPPNELYGLPKYMWLNQNTDVIKKAKAILYYEDFIGYILTGKRMVSYSSAARSMAFDIRKKEWSEELLGAAGISLQQMSVPVAPSTVIGTVLPEIAERLGLNHELKVIAGGHDQTCAALGSGLISSENGEIGMGTCEFMFTMLPEIKMTPYMIQNNFTCIPYVLNNTYLSSDAEGKTDAVTGVSISVNGFIDLATQCLEQASGIEAAEPEATEAPAEEAPASGEGTQIDAVSGATKSSTAAVNGINDAYNFLQTVK